MSDRFKNSRVHRFWRGRRGQRAARPALSSCPVYTSEAGGATATAPATAPPIATTSVATLLTRHILRDGEMILLVAKPSLWTIFFGILPAIGVALIVMISTCLWAPHHVHFGVEAGLILIGCFTVSALLSWAGRLYLLTDLRVVRIHGVFSPQIHDIPLRKIARTRLTTSFRERVCRLASIEIIPESDQWPWSVWQSLRKPDEIHEMIRRAVARSKQGGCYGSRF